MKEGRSILFVLFLWGGTLLKTVNTSSPGIVAICAIMKDEQDYVLEWLRHHIAVGVDKFFIYDHGSVPSLQKTIDSFAENKHLDIVRIEGSDFWTEVRSGKRIQSPQIWAYNQCLKRAKTSGVKFLGFIDVDEFIVLQEPQVDEIQAVLTDFEHYGGLVVNWRVFGSSQHQEKPPGGVLKNYDDCIPRTEQESRFIKTIAVVEHTQKVVSPHYCIYHEGYFAVNDQHERVWGKKSREATYSRLALHHYITKSVDEFRQKVQKGSGNFKHRAKSFISMIDEKATEKCNPQYLLSIKGRDLEAK